MKSSNWKSLYLIGGIAALLAVFVFRRNLGAEMMQFSGFGLFSVPAAPPVSAFEWFTLLQNEAFVGLTLLEVFDMVEFALLGLVFLAVTAALWQVNRSVLMMAATAGMAGVIVCFTSNQSISMLALSQNYAAAGSETQRATFLAAGEGMLAIHRGLGFYLSLFLVLLAGLLISVVMLRSNIFSRATAISGLLANGFGLLFFIILPLAPALIVLPFVISAPFRVAWYFLIARKLFELRNKEA